MKIDLNQKVNAHFQRLELLAKDAAADRDEGFSARASAMTAYSKMLQELTKTQAEIINMNRLQKVEQALIETVKEIFPPEKYHIFTEKLAELLHEYNIE